MVFSFSDILFSLSFINLPILSSLSFNIFPRSILNLLNSAATSSLDCSAPFCHSLLVSAPSLLFSLLLSALSFAFFILSLLFGGGVELSKTLCLRVAGLEEATGRRLCDISSHTKSHISPLSYKVYLSLITCITNTRTPRNAALLLFI